MNRSLGKSCVSAVILCELGWRHVREIAIELAKIGVPAFVLVKGNPGREIKAFITRRENIENYFIPRILFRVSLMSVLIYFVVFRNCRFLFWSRHRTARLLRFLCRSLRVRQIRIIEDGNEFSLEEDSRPFRLNDSKEFLASNRAVR